MFYVNTQKARILEIWNIPGNRYNPSGWHVMSYMTGGGEVYNYGSYFSKEAAIKAIEALPGYWYED